MGLERLNWESSLQREREREKAGNPIPHSLSGLSAWTTHLLKPDQARQTSLRHHSNHLHCSPCRVECSALSSTRPSGLYPSHGSVLHRGCLAASLVCISPAVLPMHSELVHLLGTHVCWSLCTVACSMFLAGGVHYMHGTECAALSQFSHVMPTPLQHFLKAELVRVGEFSTLCGRVLGV